MSALSSLLSLGSKAWTWGSGLLGLAKGGTFLVWAKVGTVALAALAFAWLLIANANLKTELAETRLAQAQANCLAAQTALRIIEREMERGRTIEAGLLADLKSLKVENSKITRERMRHAANDVAFVDGGLVLGPDLVRLLREAAGDGHGDLAMPQAAGGPAGGPGTPAAAGSGVHRLVTMADLVAWVRARCAWDREIHARLTRLAEWARGLPDIRTTEVAP